MNVRHKRSVGPEYMLDAMRITKGKDAKENILPSPIIFYQMIVAEHSPIRSVKYRFYIEDIPYNIHVHLIRHHIGVEPYVFSQRSGTDRNKRPQDEPIGMIFDLNIQSLLNVARRRLCFKADPLAQKVVLLMRGSLVNSGDQYDRIIGNLLMRPCDWHPNYCPEITTCGNIPGIIMLNKIHERAILE